MNITNIFTLLLCFFCVNSHTQEDVHIRVIPSSIDQENNELSCFSIELKGNDEMNITLASQNYRIYYNSDNLLLNSDNIYLKLPSEFYQLKIVQNLSGVNASGTGPLSFEKDLGFVNFSVVFQDGGSGGKALTRDQPWIEIFDLCFMVKDPEGPRSIILARDEMTAKYGKAFIELSAYNNSNEIIGTKISKYTDFTFKNLREE